MERLISNYDHVKSDKKISSMSVVPLSFLNNSSVGVVQLIKGKDETKRFLMNLGFVEGSEVSIISELGGNVIVQIKDARVAISKSMANKIYISVK